MRERTPLITMDKITSSPAYLDPDSGEHLPLDRPLWRSRSGRPLMLTPLPGMTRSDIDGTRRSLWRYAVSLPLAVEDPISLGEGCTPLIRRRIDGLDTFCKLDRMMPTGSFKDRGASVMLSMLRRQGINAVLEPARETAAPPSLARYVRCARRRDRTVRDGDIFCGPRVDLPGRLTLLQHGEFESAFPGSPLLATRAAVHHVHQHGLGAAGAVGGAVAAGRGKARSPAIVRHLFVMAAALSAGSLAMGVCAQVLRHRGILARDVLSIAATLFIAAELALILGLPVSSYVLWVIIASLGGASVLTYAILAEFFPTEMMGQANAALSTCHIAGAFFLQYATGFVIDQWAGVGGHYPAIAHQMAFGLVVTLQIAALAWFVRPDRAFRQMFSPSKRAVLSRPER